MDFSMPKAPSTPSTIKTTCGIDKYRLLKGDTSLFGRLRLYLFVVLASVRDVFK